MKYVLFIILAISFLNAKETYNFNEDPNWFPKKQIIDTRHIKADLRIDGDKNYLEAKVEITFSLLDAKSEYVEFYTRHLNISKIELDGINLEYKKNNDYTKIYLPKDIKKTDKNENDIIYKFQMGYSANPPDGLFFTGWEDGTHRKKKQIWAHSPQGWLPYVNLKRDIATSELIITFDENYKVLSNGKRISVQSNGDDTKTWHYKIEKPHVVYLINLVIGDYKWKEFQSNNGLDLEYWYYPEREYAYDEAYKYSKEMFDFFEVETGHKYPWSIYRQVPVIDYMYGGMETTTSTIFGDYMFIDKRGWWERPYVNVNAHELVHQWFGNYVSHLNNTHVWLTESFATYYAKIFEKSIYGDDYYQWEKEKEWQRTMEAAKRDDLPIMHSRAGVNRWYPKGSLVLDMLRYVIGDQNFQSAIKHYLDENKYSVVWTPDLIKAIRNATGESPEWFFHQWVWHGGEPHYNVQYKDVLKNNKIYTLIEIEQIHEINDVVNYFEMPIKFEVWYKDGTKDMQKEWVKGKYSQVWIENQNDKEIDFVLFDPGREILKNVTFARSIDELTSQAIKADKMIDKFDAINAMRSFDINEKAEKLSKIYTNLKYHLTKSAVIKQIAKDDKNVENIYFQNIMDKALYDGEEWVSRSILENFEFIPKIYKTEFELFLKDSSYTNVKIALDKLCRSFPEETKKYLELTKDEKGWRGKNIRIKWLEIKTQTETGKYLDELIDYSSKSFEFETNINAFYALKLNNILNDQIITNLFRGLFHWNFKLRNAASECLRYYYGQTEYRKFIDEYINLKEFPASKQNLIDKIKK